VAKLDDWDSSKRSRSEQEGFKDALVTNYQRQGPAHPNGTQTLICMVVNKPMHKGRVIASHIAKHEKLAKMKLYGLQETDINDPRNGLLLAKKIQDAFDVKHVCFNYDPIHQVFNFRVLNPALLNDRIYTPDPSLQGDYDYPDTFASLNGQPLQLPRDEDGHPLIRPWVRIIGYHARCAHKFARQARWITEEELQNYLAYDDFVMKSDSPKDFSEFEDYGDDG